MAPISLCGSAAGMVFLCARVFWHFAKVRISHELTRLIQNANQSSKQSKIVFLIKKNRKILKLHFQCYLYPSN